MAILVDLFCRGGRSIAQAQASSLDLIALCPAWLSLTYLERRSIAHAFCARFRQHLPPAVGRETQIEPGGFHLYVARGLA